METQEEKSTGYTTRKSLHNSFKYFVCVSIGDTSGCTEYFERQFNISIFTL